MTHFALLPALLSCRLAAGPAGPRWVAGLLLTFTLTASAAGCRDRSADDALAQQRSAGVESESAASQPTYRDRADDEVASSRPALAPATLPQEQRASGYYPPQPGEPLASVEAHRREGGPMAILDDTGEAPTPRAARAGFDDDDFGPADQRALEERIRQELRQARSAGLSDADLASLSIAVDQGSVTLSGTVESDDVVRAVEELVSRVPGVGNVHNRLEARNGTRTAE